MTTNATDRPSLTWSDGPVRSRHVVSAGLTLSAAATLALALVALGSQSGAGLVAAIVLGLPCSLAILAAFAAFDAVALDAPGSAARSAVLVRSVDVVAVCDEAQAERRAARDLMAEIVGAENLPPFTQGEHDRVSGTLTFDALADLVRRAYDAGRADGGTSAADLDGARPDPGVASADSRAGCRGMGRARGRRRGGRPTGRWNPCRRR